MVISTACFTPVNRSIYKELSILIDILLIIPNKLNISGKIHNVDISEYKTANYSIISANARFTDNPRIVLFKSILKNIKSFKPDFVILDFDPFSLITLQLIVFSFIFKFKIISLTYENRKFNKINFSNFTFSLGFKHLFKFLFKHFLTNNLFNVVTFNNSGFELYKNYGFKTSITVLGYDSKIFKISDQIRQYTRDSLNINDCEVVISYFGRLVPEKGVDLLLDALTYFKNSNFVLLIDQFDIYRNEYSKKIADQIKNLSPLKIIQVDPSYEEIWKYMNATDLVILPSISTNNWEEQYGRVASESMACGKLVLVSNSGHLPDLIDKFGVVFTQNDVSSLISKLNNFKSLVDINNFIARDSISNYANNYLSIKVQVDFFVGLMK
jgi:glycosyltransferase involved in cell wall biosynthesis